MSDTTITAWPEWMRPAVAASYTGLARSYLYQLMSAEAIPYHKRGRARLLKKSDLDAYMEKGRKEAI